MEKDALIGILFLYKKTTLLGWLPDISKSMRKKLSYVVCFSFHFVIL